MADNAQIDFLFNQAVIAHGQGRLPEARAGYEKILQKVPRHIEALKRLALVELQSGQPGRGYEIIKRANQLKPRSKSVLEILAVAAMQTKNYAVAVQCFDVLTKAQPNNPLYLSEWSKAEYELGNLNRAIGRYQDFLDRQPNRGPEHYFVLGRLYYLNREPSKAADQLDKAMAAGFTNSELLAIRANCYIHEGKEDQALAFFEKALALDPDNIEAHYQHRALIETKKGDPIFEHLERLKTKSGVSGTPEINLYFLLGHLYQKIGDYGQAFANYLEANRKTDALFKAEGIQYDPGVVGEEFARLTSAFSAENQKAAGYQGSDSEVPVFIVGMPRSGTTLLEQIIASHPEAEGRGECDAMHYIHTELEDDLKRGVPLEKILKKKGAKWQQSYLEALNAPEGILRVTDKLPANFRSIGLIALLFPNAKIIHIRRNPLDTCVSIFSNLFDKGHSYSTSLYNIGDYYARVEALMEVWKKLLSIPILEVIYEDLVENQEQKSKEIIKFLGLEWDPACLEFHKKDHAAMTLSSIQVRRPMTSSSIARWKRFEGRLDELEKGLGEDLSLKAKENA